MKYNWKNDPPRRDDYDSDEEYELMYAYWEECVERAQEERRIRDYERRKM